MVSFGTARNSTSRIVVTVNDTRIEVDGGGGSSAIPPIPPIPPMEPMRSRSLSSVHRRLVRGEKRRAQRELVENFEEQIRDDIAAQLQRQIAEHAPVEPDKGKDEDEDKPMGVLGAGVLTWIAWLLFSKPWAMLFTALILFKYVQGLRAGRQARQLTEGEILDKKLAALEAESRVLDQRMAEVEDS